MTTRAYFSSFLSLLLIVGLTVNDVGKMLFEIEDVLEIKEVEEELREGSEGEKDWLRHLDFGDDGTFRSQDLSLHKRSEYDGPLDVSKLELTYYPGRPLYLLHCSLKIPLS